MKQIYGFKTVEDDPWGDVFDHQDHTPEDIISSACHIYYDLDGNSYVGFDMSLGLSKKEMKTLLVPHSKKIGIHKVL